MRNTALNNPTPDRIEYIVYSHPDKVESLIEGYGYEAPEDLEELVETMKFLIRKYKKKAVIDLLKIHPDRKALLSLEEPKEDNFCSACANQNYNGEEHSCGCGGHSNYTGSRTDFIAQLQEMGETELEEHYAKLLDKSNQNPNDKKLSEELQLVWNRFRNIKKTEASEKTERILHPLEFQRSAFYTLLGVSLVIGVVIGTGFIIKS